MEEPEPHPPHLLCALAVARHSERKLFSTASGLLALCIGRATTLRMGYVSFFIFLPTFILIAMLGQAGALVSHSTLHFQIGILLGHETKHRHTRLLFARYHTSLDFTSRHLPLLLVQLHGCGM